MKGASSLNKLLLGTLRLPDNSTVNESLTQIARMNLQLPSSMRKAFTPSALLIGFSVRDRFRFVVINSNLIQIAVT